MEMVNQKIGDIEHSYNVSDLPDRPDEKEADRLLARIREKFYEGL
jgi:hypothetical protein